MSLLSVWLELLEFDFGTQSAIMWITLMLKNLCWSLLVHAHRNKGPRMAYMPFLSQYAEKQLVSPNIIAL